MAPPPLFQPSASWFGQRRTYATRRHQRAARSNGAAGAELEVAEREGGWVRLLILPPPIRDGSRRTFDPCCSAVGSTRGRAVKCGFCKHRSEAQG